MSKNDISILKSLQKSFEELKETIRMGLETIKQSRAEKQRVNKEYKKSGVKKKRRHFKSDRDKKFDIYATREDHKRKARNRKLNDMAQISRKKNRK